MCNKPLYSSYCRSNEYTILEVLNTDCWRHILDHVPFTEVIRSEIVSRHWQNVIHEYLLGIHGIEVITNYIPSVPYKSRRRFHVVQLSREKVDSSLEAVLSKLGPYVIRINANQRWLEDIANNCLALEEILLDFVIDGLEIVAKKCTRLRNVSFINSLQLRDSTLSQFFKSIETIEELTITGCRNVTGDFLKDLGANRLTRFEFHGDGLEFENLLSAVENLRSLVALNLDNCDLNIICRLHLFLDGLPMLEELSLVGHERIEDKYRIKFIDGLSKLKHLKTLRLARNENVNDVLFRMLGDSCRKLQCLDASRWLRIEAVSDAGVSSLCRGCRDLSSLNLENQVLVGDESIKTAAIFCPNLKYVNLRGTNVTDAAVATLIDSCHKLKSINLIECRGITEELFLLAGEVLEKHPHNLKVVISIEDVHLMRRYRAKRTKESPYLCIKSKFC